MVTVVWEDRRTEEQKASDKARSEAFVTRQKQLLGELPAICSRLSPEDESVILEIVRGCAAALLSLAKQMVSSEDIAIALPKLISAVMTAEAKRKAWKRISNDRDGKQAAKAEVFKLWQEWQAGKTLHKSGAAFARFVCNRFSALESPISVERWARNWAAEKAKK